MDRLLAVNAEYKRQAIEYSNRIDELESALEKIAGSLNYSGFTGSDKYVLIKIAEQALKGGESTD